MTSYNELRRDALAIERWNRLHPAEPEKTPYIVTALQGSKGPIIAASDYMKSLPDQLAPWLSTRLVTLGTDGFGRSDNREYLRRHFEVNAESIVAATLRSSPATASSTPPKRSRPSPNLESTPKNPTRLEPERILVLPAGKKRNVMILRGSRQR